VKCGKKNICCLLFLKKSILYNTNYTYGANVNDRKIQSDSKILKPSNVTGYAPQLYAWFWTYKTHMTTVEGALIGQLEEVFRVGI
jgi:hypothetical protein